MVPDTYTNSVVLAATSEWQHKPVRKLSRIVDHREKVLACREDVRECLKEALKHIWACMRQRSQIQVLDITVRDIRPSLLLGGKELLKRLANDTIVELDVLIGRLQEFLQRDATVRCTNILGSTRVAILERRCTVLQKSLERNGCSTTSDDSRVLGEC